MSNRSACLLTYTPPGSLRLSSLALLALAFGLAPALRADVVFSSFNVIGNNAVGAISGSDYGVQDVAAAFTPGADYVFTEAEVALYGYNATSVVDASIYSNTTNSSGNAPGTSLLSIGSIGPITAYGTSLYTVDSLTNSFTLHNGVEYWLVLTPGTRLLTHFGCRAT